MTRRPRTMQLLLLTVAAAAVWVGALGAQESPALSVTLANGSDDEAATRNELLELVRQNQLRDWVVTPEVVIDETAIPHSHPVLTIHTRHRGDTPQLLSTFLHEQFHWWLNERQEALDAAVASFRRLFPEVPAGGQEGARDEYSTYLHLAVCHLELQATALLLGEEAARDVLGRYTHYVWIYRQVLENDEVGAIMRRSGLTLS